VARSNIPSVHIAACLALVAAAPVLAQPSVPGMVVTAYGEYGTSYLPGILVFDDAGYLYASADFAGAGGTQIRRVPPGGGNAVVFSNSNIFDPDGILYDRTGAFSSVTGAILLGCSEPSGTQGRIRAVRPNGTDFTASGPLAILANCGPMAFDSTNRLHVAVFTNRTIVRYTGGTPAVFLTLPGSLTPANIVIDANDRLWVSCSDGAMRRYSPSAALEATITVGGQWPGVGTNDHAGSFATGIYVNNRSTGVLSRVGANDALTTIGTGFPGAVYPAFDNAGAMYTNENTSGRIWKFECVMITAHPVNTSTCPGGTPTFTVTATSVSAMTYQWQWEEVGHPGVWTNLVNGANVDSGGISRFTASGATASSVTLARDNHLQGAVDVISLLRCIVTNSCGSATSNAAGLAVCVADTDDGSGTGLCDGGVGIEDLLNYLVLYNAGAMGADLDDGTSTGTRDGGVGIEDLLYYLQHYNAGC